MLYLIDLDDTLYFQFFYDVAILRKSFSFLSHYVSPSLMTTSCLNSLIFHRSFDRKSRTLFSDVLASYGFNRNESSNFFKLYRFYASCLDVDISLFKGAYTFLKSIASEQNTIVIVTNGPLQQQSNKVRLLGLNSFINGVIYCDGLNIPLKPDPSSVLNFLTSHGCSCDIKTAIVIGDDQSTDGQLATLLGCKYLHPSQLWSLT